MADDTPNLSAAPPSTDLSALTQPTSGPPMAQGGAPAQDSSQPPNISGYRPNIINLISGMINPSKGTPAGQRAPGRLDVFESFVGNFMQAMASGLQNAGHGPGANARAFGAGVNAPYQRDVQQFGLNQQAQENQARIQQQQAQTEATRMQSQLVDTPYGEMQPGLAKILFQNQGKIDVQNLKNTGASNLEQIKEQGRQRLQAARNASPLTQAQVHKLNADAELKEAMNDPESPAYKLALQKVQWANYMREASLDLQRQRMDFQQNGPTSQIRTQGQMAGELLDHVGTIKQQIAALGAQGKLGPLAGRWNEFMAGKVGSGDPDYVSLRTNLGLFQTALMKAHVGSRGSEMMMEHFKNLLDSGRMTPEALDSAMNSVTGYLNTYVKGAQYTPPGKSGSKNAPKDPVGDLVGKYGGKRP